MKLPRLFTAAVAATTLCVGGTFAVAAQSASAADTSPVQTIFFGRELLAFQCGLHGGTFYVSGSGYGCHLAGGGEIYCEGGSCTWWPAAKVNLPTSIAGLGLTNAQLQVASSTPPKSPKVNPIPRPQLARAAS
jgi:hypothetical protein